MVIIDTNKVQDIGLKTRHYKDGPEMNLVNEFIDEVPKLFKSKKNEIALFIEPLIDRAYPDIVVTEYDPRIIEKWDKRRNLLDEIDFKIFENLRLFRGLNSQDLFKKTNFDYKTQLISLEKLLDAGLVHREQGKWKTKPLKEIYSIKRLISIEAKMKEWKTLLNQAEANQWFASESYALSSVKSPRETTVSRFREYGIGLYTLSDKKLLQLNEASKKSLPNSYMSWMFNEWIGRYTSQI